MKYVRWKCWYDIIINLCQPECRVGEMQGNVLFALCWHRQKLGIVKTQTSQLRSMVISYHNLRSVIVRTTCKHLGFQTKRKENILCFNEILTIRANDQIMYKNHYRWSSALLQLLKSFSRQRQCSSRHSFSCVYHSAWQQKWSSVNSLNVSNSVHYERNLWESVDYASSATASGFSLESHGCLFGFANL